MKRFILFILFLFLNLQLLAKADDIKEFEIEGYSIGDSLLNHFSKKEIENNRFEFLSKNKKYSYSEISGKFENFKNLQFIYKKNDKEYEIFAIVGIIFYNNDLNGCLEKKQSMVQSVKSIMPSDTDRYDNDGYSHSKQFPKSLIYSTEFTFKNGDVARVYCLNWSSDVEKNQGWTDHLSLNIQTKKFMNWLNNEAYK
tara:strand:+ start:172 stop:762 length:591 start_codon:yes stop_codon:yes gene_type:complete